MSARRRLEARLRTLPSALLAVAIAVFLTAVAVAQARPPRAAEAVSRQPSSDAVSSGFSGSEACERCHEPEYDTWKKSLHVQMTKPIAEAMVVGDFRPGTRLDDSGTGRAYAMEKRDGKYTISITRTGRPTETFNVDYTLGARRFQGYLSKLPDGRIYVLPVFWHNETKRWIDYSEITPVPDDPSHDLRQIWNVTCVNCHATNLVRNYNVASNTFATTWTEMGIGCEACHGPGRAHIDDPEHLQIFTMKKVAPRQIFDTCGYCHGNKNNVFFGFKPGDRYEDYALPFLISQPIPANDPQGEFWPDGRPSRFNRPQALMLTGCFRSGQATCTSCHRIHGNQNNHALKVPIDDPAGGHSRQSDSLCTQCHAVSESGGALGAGGAGGSGGPGGPGGEDRKVGTDGKDGKDRSRVYENGSPEWLWPTSIPDLSGHTHHKADSQGSRCINCHMSDVNWRLITRRLDHTFQPPVPEMTARYGVPNACTSCHEDKSPEWAAKTMDAWYGNRDARAGVTAMADVIYRAGSGDTTSLPQVATLSVDRSHGALIRASAAEFAGQLIGKISSSGSAGTTPTFDTAVVNALIGAAADPEPMVRITAVRALGLVREPRILAVMTAHLIDSSRVVRVSAAESLMNLGVTKLDGEAGAALERAQDEWAQSLRTFNDAAGDQAMLGWLSAARGRTDEATTALEAAVRLDPNNAQPHVYLGVLAARAGRFDEAVKQFKAAKALDSSYPNIDRLIDEAAKRR